MLVKVLSANGPYKVTSDFESYLGRFKAGDMVLEPTSAGASHYWYTEKEFPIFIEDVRKRNMQEHLSEVDLSRRSARVPVSTAAKPPNSSNLCSLHMVSCQY